MRGRLWNTTSDPFGCTGALLIFRRCSRCRCGGARSPRPPICSAAGVYLASLAAARVAYVAAAPLGAPVSG
jgi:hypothetical protein